MKTITIKSLDLVNFKGIRSLHVDFDKTITQISGRNGSGKTTIFDAFTWVLFGKDSKDRKDFGIKTYGPDGKTIERLPHEVECELLVSGETVTLKRCYCEKWTKKRGSVTEEFTGHEEERYVNGVPCSLKEYQAKVAEICDETVFKFVTNPLYFTSQKADVQRTMLFRMAGEVSDEQVAEGNDDFVELLRKLTGKTMEEYRKEIQAKKRRLKETIEGIPGRIEERQRDMPADCNWSLYETTVENLKREIAGYDSQLSDINEAMKAETAKRQAKLDRIMDLKKDVARRELDIERESMAEYYEYQDHRRALEKELPRLNALIADSQRLIGLSESRLTALAEDRKKLLAEWNAIKADKLVFDQSQFVCPTCGREYEFDEIESIRDKVSAQWNEKQAQRLEDNKTKGLAVRARITDEESTLEALKSTLGIQETALVQAQNELKDMVPVARPDLEGLFAKDETILSLKKQIAEAEGVEEIPFSNGSDEIRAKKAEAMNNLSDVERVLGTRTIIANNKKRIEELEDELAIQSQELALLEGEEFTMAAFSKAKISAIEGKINGLFETVRFKMFDTQINGGEIETCEATVNGVPFSDLNSAGKINAGLDIINAICENDDLCAPIFIDNSESILEPLRTKGQQVWLTVKDCDFNVTA